MRPLTILANISLEATSRREDLGGIEHLVIPCVAIKEGILNNIFYSAIELEKFVDAWNGVPIPVNHPIDENGNKVTANSIHCEETTNIGKFFNVTFEDNAIKGEIWINITKANELGHGDIIDTLEEGNMMELSTGLYADTIPNDGIFNNTTYSAVISNIRPDHLALLPDDTGACSLEDGCGAMRTNKKDEPCCNSCGDKERKGFWNSVFSFFKTNEKSHNELYELLRTAIIKGLPSDSWAYVVDVYDNFVIYETGNLLFKQSYHNEDNTVSLVGDAVEVVLERSYIPVSVEPVTNIETDHMKPETKTSLVSVLALALVGNAADKVTDESKEHLAGMPDEMLTNMAKAQGIEITPCGQVKTNKEEPTTPVVVPAATAPAVDNGLTANERETLKRLSDAEQARLVTKRANLLANNDNLTQGMVDKLDEATLDAMLANGQATPQGQVDHSFTAPVTNSDEPRVRPSIMLEEPSKD